jgi:hypothetical protein
VWVTQMKGCVRKKYGYSVLLVVLWSQWFEDGPGQKWMGICSPFI